MPNTQYPVYPVGPSHPPGTTIGQGVQLTQQAIRQYENFFEVQWDNIQDIPQNISDSRFNVKRYGALGNGITDDSAAIALAVAAANAYYLNSGTNLVTAGAVVYFPPGNYRTTLGFKPLSGVRLVASGAFSSCLIPELSTATDCITFDAATTSNHTLSGFAQVGGIEDMKIASRSYLVNGSTCNRMVVAKQVNGFSMTRVILLGAYGRLLHIESCIDVSITKCQTQISNGDCCVWVGSPLSITTTTAFYSHYAGQCNAGPAYNVAGIGVAFYSCIAESCGLVTPAGSYGFQIRYGTVALYSPYCEDVADNDFYFGSEDYPAGGRTAITLSNPTIVGGAHKLAGVGGIKINYSDHTIISGGDISVPDVPLLINDTNAGGVWVSSDFGGSTKKPTLTSGLHWRTKLNLTWVSAPVVVSVLPQQTVNKAAIAASGGTAVIDIPASGTSTASVMRVLFEIYYEGATNLRAIGQILIARESDGRTEGSLSTTIISNDTSGNFQVATGNFAVDFTHVDGASRPLIRLTYTSANPTGTNFAQFQIDALSLSSPITGTVTIT